MTRSAVLIICFLFLTSSIAVGQGTDFFWVQPSGGDFQISNNWEPFGAGQLGPGGQKDRVHFDLDAPLQSRYTVTNVNGINQQLIVENDSLVLEINGLYQTSSEDGGFLAGFVAGQIPGDFADVIIRGNGPSIIDTRDATLGFQSVSTGIVTLEGKDITWDLFSMDVGFEGDGFLNVVDGAELVTRNVNVGRSAGSNGRIVVDGKGSRWENEGVPTIGGLGDGELVISNGGESQVNVFGTTLARCPSGDGCVIIEGPGSQWTTRTVLVSLRGNSFPNALVTVREGARWSARDVQIGDNADAWGVVEVSGAGSLIEIDEELVCGRRGSGELVVENQAMVTCADVFVSQSDPGNSASATLDICGKGSCLWVSNSMSVNGNESGKTVGGGALVAIEDDASLIVGNEIVVFPGGEVNLTSGLLVADSVRFNGGGILGLNGGEFSVLFYLDDMTNVASTLSPGHNQAGSTTVFGDYVQQNEAALKIDIGGIGVGSESDFVTVADNVFLDGQLQIDLINDFVPLAGQSFIVLGTGADIFGFFDNAGDSQRVDTLGGEGSFLVRYGITSPNPDQIILSDYKPNPLLGDVNCDGVVDLLDVDPFIEVLTVGPYQIKADINQDGEVNLLDVNPFVDLLL